MTGAIVSPVLPEIIQQLQLDPKWAGMLGSTHALTTALATPLFGILADRIGKLPVMIPCLMLYALVGVLGGFMHTLPPLLISRALLGLFSGGITAATIGILGTLYDGEERSRVLGYATSAMTTASILLPLIGGWVGSSNWRYCFYLYSLGIPLALIVALTLRDRRSRGAGTVIAMEGSQLSKIILQPHTLMLYLTLAMAALVMYSVVIYTPIYLKSAIGAGPELNGLILALRGIGAAVISALGATWVARRVGPNRAIGLGFALMGGMLIILPFLTQLQWIVPTALLFGAGFGILTPITYNAIANQSPPELRASVLAIGTGTNSLGQFISPVILGPIWKTAGLPMVFYVAGGLALLMGLLSASRQEAPPPASHH